MFVACLNMLMTVKQLTLTQILRESNYFLVNIVSNWHDKGLYFPWYYLTKLLDWESHLLEITHNRFNIYPNLTQFVLIITTFWKVFHELTLRKLDTSNCEPVFGHRILVIYVKLDEINYYAILLKAFSSNHWLNKFLIGIKSYTF